MLWTKNKILVILLIIFGGVVFFIVNSGQNQPQVSPNILISSPSPSIFPKEIKYDSSTDLKKELDTVNPQVLDSDF